PGRVRVGPGGRTLVTYDIAPDDVRRMHRAVCLTAEICLAAGARRLYPQIPSLPIIEAKEGLRALREARLGAGDMQWIAYHPVGTCKMGKDPRSSVVDLAHECHDVPNLHVVDGSTVPGPLGVNPQITIMSMATRAAGLIDERLS
ncbi:MAG: GMC family oxidoreductase, partial [Sandaracinaceae bacterium]|nr:GMC family oxidoreductase [Sandaracinaceae bacterium]